MNAQTDPKELELGWIHLKEAFVEWMIRTHASFYEINWAKEQIKKDYADRG